MKPNAWRIRHMLPWAPVTLLRLLPASLLPASLLLASLLALPGPARAQDGEGNDADERKAGQTTNANTDGDDTSGDETNSSDGEDKDSQRWAVLVASLTIFVLAVFVGFEIITKVPPTLHTPLMSGSNAISGITLVGALLATGGKAGGFVAFFGLIAVIMATVNAVGGFAVTHRMLAMFQRKR